MRLNKKEKMVLEKLKKAGNTLGRNFVISLETGGSVLGFILGQFVWIWILRGFLDWFGLWFCEITEYQIWDVMELRKIFWILYGVWFFISIVTRLNIRAYTSEEKK